jgi:hypothetical protein
MRFSFGSRIDRSPFYVGTSIPAGLIDRDGQAPYEVPPISPLHS